MKITKKITLGLLFVLCLFVLASCSFFEDANTQLSFSVLPESTYIEGSSVLDAMNTIKITVINGEDENVFTLKEIKDAGGRVSGLDFATTGVKVLTVSYQGTRITFEYEVLPAVSCTHPYESLDESTIVWKEFNGYVCELSCCKDGELASAHCNACGKDVSNITYKALGHDNKVTLEEDFNGDSIVDTIEFEAAYCKRCGLLIAFVDELDEQLTGADYKMDAVYSFKSFSKKPIKVNGQEVYVQDGELVPLSVFRIFYEGIESGEIQGFESLSVPALIDVLDDLVYYFMNNPSSLSTFISNNKFACYLIFNIFGVEFDQQGNITSLGGLEYYGWYADFQISFNQDVSLETFGLGGDYGGWTLSFLASEFGNKLINNNVVDKDLILDKYVSVRMLENGFSYRVGYGQFILTLVRDFMCGIFNLYNGVNVDSPLIASVDLIIINPEKEEEYKVICTTTYQFEPCPIQQKIIDCVEEEKIDTEGYYVATYDGKPIFLYHNGVTYDYRNLASADKFEVDLDNMTITDKVTNKVYVLGSQPIIIDSGTIDNNWNDYDYQIIKLVIE